MTYSTQGLLEFNAGYANEKDVAESIEGIDRNVEYINKIVADLQDYAREINPSIQEVDLQTLFCIDELSKNSDQPNINASCTVEEEAKIVTSDAALLKRILSNLISNAIQAMPQGGNLTLHAYREAEDVVITVEDTGVGIPKAVKEKLFTPMFTTKAKGQGFGLSVVKRLTEALGGTVSYESEVGRGTKFTVRLPPK